MRKYSVCFLGMLFLLPAHADQLLLDNALRATYTACVGIDDDLADLKKMAGINTAVTGVGTAAGAGATVVGVIKANKDKRIRELEEILETLRNQDENIPEPEISEAEHKANVDAWGKFRKNAKETETEIQKLEAQSKKLGNWRTGLMAGSTVTNVAGAIIASKNGTNGEIQDKIDECRKAVDALNLVIGQVRMDGVDVSEATSIVAACREYDGVNISAIEKRAKGAMVSSIVGATTGVAGTVTSAMANTDATRNDNTDAGKQKEKNLNTASNILAGATTAASATATVFNATQISAIKKVATVAEKCTGVLK